MTDSVGLEKVSEEGGRGIVDGGNGGWKGGVDGE